MIEIVNRQRRRAMDIDRWQDFAQNALAAIGKAGYSATVAFVSDRKIQELNKRFRGVNKPTDVLSFPACSNGFENVATNLGDIAVSVPRAESQARENGLQFDQEISQLLLHGLLHLCGYDHETDDGEMNRCELQLRSKLGIDL